MRWWHGPPPCVRVSCQDPPIKQMHRLIAICRKISTKYFIATQLRIGFWQHRQTPHWIVGLSAILENIKRSKRHVK